MTYQLHDFTDEDGRKLKARLHDADTMYTLGGRGIRFGGGVNAAETGKFTEIGGYAVGSPLGVAQGQAVESLIDDYSSLPKFTSGAYNRSVAIPTNPETGAQLSSDMIANDIVPANNFTPAEDLSRRTLTRFQRDFLPDKPPTKLDEARMMVESVLSQGTLIPREQTNTIEEYQDYTTATSFKGLAQQEQQIKELEQRILSPKITPAQRMAYEIKLGKAKESYQSNLNAPQDFYINSLEGVNTPGTYGVMAEFGRALDQGLLSVKENAANMLDYVGAATGFEPASWYAKEKKKDYQREGRLIDLKAGDVDPTGGTVTQLKDVEADPSKIFKFVGTTLLSQGPLMAAMVGSSLAGGVLAGPVGATIGPMMIGIGDVYGEMPDDEKKVLAAGIIGGAVGLIDRFGFAKGAIKPLDLITKEGLSKVAGKIAVTEGITVEAAKKLLNTEIRVLGASYAQVVKSTMASQIVAKKGLDDLLMSITKASGKEAATEALQEALQALGIASVTSVDVDYEKLYQRVKEAAIVGGILGGAMDTPHSMYQHSMFNQDRNMLQGIETKPRTSQSKIAEEEIKRNGGMIDDIQLAARLSAVSGSSRDSSGVDKTLESLVVPGDKSSLIDDTKYLAENGGLLAPSRDNIVEPYIQFEGGREIAGLLDTRQVRGAYAGLSAFKRVHMIANSIMSKIPTLTEKRKLFGTDNGKDIGTMLMSSLHSATPSPAAVTYRTMLDQMGAELADSLIEVSPGKNRTGWDAATIRSPDFFIRNQIMDPKLVSANPDEFMDLLAKHWKFSGTVAHSANSSAFKDLTDRIRDNMTHREIRELMELGVLDNPAFDKFKNKDVEKNVVSMISAISRGAVRNSIYGSKGEILAKGIYKMLDAGEITQAQASRLALDLGQYMDEFDGRLNKINNPLMRAAQDNMIFLSVMSYMDTSLFANMGEVVFSALGLPPKKVGEFFWKSSKTFATDAAAKITQLGSKLSGGAIKGKSEEELSTDINELSKYGHAGHMNDIAFTIGANITTQSKRNMGTILFKANMVESMTNSARAVRASFALDEFNRLTAILAEASNDNDMTRWARDRLQYYRVDPDKMVSFYNQVGNLSTEKIEELSKDPAQSQLFNQIYDTVRDGTINFVDEFSARPEPGSTPKLLSDHRFMLFTQFKKFTYHVSANIIPQLWNMYVKRGDATLTYSAFALAVMAFAVAYAGMHLKTMFRGEDDDNDSLMNRKLVQAFNYSWGQAPSDLASTVSTATSSKGNALDTLVRMSPAANLTRNIAKDSYKVATKDDDEKEKLALIKRIPIAGEIPAVRKYFEGK